MFLLFLLIHSLWFMYHPRPPHECPSVCVRVNNFNLVYYDTHINKLIHNLDYYDTHY